MSGFRGLRGLGAWTSGLEFRVYAVGFKFLGVWGSGLRVLEFRVSRSLLKLFLP